MKFKQMTGSLSLSWVISSKSKTNRFSTVMMHSRWLNRHSEYAGVTAGARWIYSAWENCYSLTDQTCKFL